MVRKILAIVLGLLAGFFGIFLVELVAMTVYPLPLDLDMNDHEALKAFMAKMPTGAFLFILLAHGVGSVVGGFVCALIAGKKWYLGAAILGIFLLLAGIANLVMVPHPLWFAVLDVLIYLPFALLGCSLAATIKGLTR